MDTDTFSSFDEDRKHDLLDNLSEARRLRLLLFAQVLPIFCLQVSTLSLFFQHKIPPGNSLRYHLVFDAQPRPLVASMKLALTFGQRSFHANLVRKFRFDSFSELEGRLRIPYEMKDYRYAHIQANYTAKSNLFLTRLELVQEAAAGADDNIFLMCNQTKLPDGVTVMIGKEICQSDPAAENPYL